MTFSDEMLGDIQGAITGRILRVDLSTGTITTDRTEQFAKRWIGGQMLNSWLLLSETPRGTRWSDPGAPLIFGAGALSGTLVPSACRTSVDTINVFSGGKGSANMGGNFGPMLKFAGFDHIVIKGKAAAPTYLWVHGGRAELRDAAFLWGKTISETELALRRELSSRTLAVAAIGPAGEHKVKGACIVNTGGKVAGGSGVGCVMGDKNLKAIVVDGDGVVELADPERFMAAVDVARRKIDASPYSNAMRNEGLVVQCYLAEHTKEYPDGFATVRNAQEEWWPPEKREELCGRRAGVPSHMQKIFGCISCPISCMPYMKIDSGKYAGMHAQGYWCNAVLWSQKTDVTDPEASLAGDLLCNDLGLDGDNTHVPIAWAFEAYEKGLLTKADTDGLALEWGDGDVVVELIKKIAYRDGFGDFLADGVVAAAAKLGHGSEKFATSLMGQDTLDPFRVAPGWGLGVATSPVAGRHLRGAVYPAFTTGPHDQVWDDYGYDPAIPEAVFWMLRTKQVEDALGVCNYTSSYLAAYAVENADLAEELSAAMGVEVTAEELLWRGQRGYNLEKAFNTIHTDWERAANYPPPRFFDEPITQGPYAGRVCDRAEWDKMLDRFYELHGWDKATSLQTRDVLSALAMDDVAEMIAATGKLKEATRARGGGA